MVFKDYDYDLKNEIAECRDCNKNDLYKFLLYKKLSSKKHFDCDRCDYAKKVYSKLWEFDDKINASYQTIKIGSKEILMGMDTMNSFWTTFSWCLNNWCIKDIQIEFGIEKVTLNSIEALLSNFDALKFIIIKNLSESIYIKLLTLAKLTHTIGNLILIPKNLSPYTTEKESFNMIRNTLYNDYFDLSLQCLLNNAESEWNEETVKTYSEMFLLDDYIDDGLNIIPYNECHEKIIYKGEKNDGRPQTKAELEALLFNICVRIVRRGEKMQELLTGKSACDDRIINIKEPEKNDSTAEEKEKIKEDKYKGKEKVFFTKNFFFFLIMFLIITNIFDCLIQTVLFEANVGLLQFGFVQFIYNIVIYVFIPVYLSYFFSAKRRKKYIDSFNTAKSEKIEIKYISRKSTITGAVLIDGAIILASWLLANHWENVAQNNRLVSSLIIEVWIIFIVFLIIYIPILLSGLNKRCRNCKMLFAIKEHKTVKVGEKLTQVVVNNKIKNKDGEVTGTVEQRVPGKQVFYKTIYKCKSCGQIHYIEYAKEYIQ